jgi:hypothetical protein
MVFPSKDSSPFIFKHFTLKSTETPTLSFLQKILHPSSSQILAEYYVIEALKKSKPVSKVN